LINSLPQKDYFIFFLKKKEAKKGAHLKFNGMAKSPPELREISEILIRKIRNLLHFVTHHALQAFRKSKIFFRSLNRA
jgi:hypothetical protein